MSSFVDPRQTNKTAMIIIPLQDILEVSTFGTYTSLTFKISSIEQARESTKGVSVRLLAIEDVIRLIALIL